LASEEHCYDYKDDTRRLTTTNNKQQAWRMVKKKQEATIGHLEQAGGTFVSFFAYHTNVQI